LNKLVGFNVPLDTQ